MYGGRKLKAAAPTRRRSLMSTRRGADVGKSVIVLTALKYDCSAKTFSANRLRVIVHSPPTTGA